MKRIWALCLSCLLLACMGAGCGKAEETKTEKEGSAVSEEASSKADDSNDRNESKADTKDASEGKKASSADEESEDNGGITIDEDGNIHIDESRLDEWDTVDDGEDSKADNTSNDNGTVLGEDGYRVLYLSPANMGQKNIKSCTLIDSVGALEKFIGEKGAEYSLNTAYAEEEGGVAASFVEVTKSMDTEFFKQSDLIVVVASFVKGQECDLGELLYQNGELRVSMWAAEPADKDNKSYFCALVTIDKGNYKLNKTEIVYEMPETEEAV